MKIAYIILAHKLPGQLLRLINRLNTADSAFFIHIDKKVDKQLFKQIKESFSNFSNVVFVKRYKSKWGQMGIVQGTLSGLREIARSQMQYDYVCLLSGQCYPIKSPETIRSFLSENKGNSFIDFRPITADQNQNREERYIYWHYFFRNFHLVFPREKMFDHRLPDLVWRKLVKLFPFRRKLPLGYNPYWGYQWWCLTGACADYIVNFLEENPSFEKFFKRVWCPDEFFFQIILKNSPFAETLQNHCLTYVDFSQKKSHHPATLGTTDFDKFMASDKLFARKFDSSLDPQILDLIDQSINSADTEIVFAPRVMD